jgi:hypothetical protein
MIERKASENANYDTTLAGFQKVVDDPAAQRTKPSILERRPRAKAIFDDDNSDTTQEFGELAEALRVEERERIAEDPANRPKKARTRSSAGKKRVRSPSPKRVSTPAPHFDEDATEIADHPPGQAPPSAVAHVEATDEDDTDGLERAPAAPRAKHDTVPTREPPRLESGESEIKERGPKSGTAAQAEDKGGRTIAARKLEPKPTAADVGGAVPRHLLGKWGTDAVGAAAQRANIARLDESLPQARSPVLKMLRSELTREEIASLETALAGTYDVRGMEPSLSPKRSLEHLTNEPAYNELSLPERARLLKAIAADPRDVATTKSAIAVLKTGIVKRIRLDEREKLLAIFGALTSETRALFARLAARPLRGRSALEDRDFKDVGIVSNLFELVIAAGLPASMEHAGVKKSRVLTLVLSSVAHPERLPFEEGTEGVLSMFEFALADTAPAELVRLWLQLVTGDMRADLAGEAELDLGARIEAPGGVAFSSRETPLRVALEHLAVLARPRKGADQVGFVMPGGHGVDADVISRALSFVFGVPFTVAAGPPTALRHLLRINAEPYRVPPVFVTLLYDRGERLFIFDHLDEARAYLRAPHGRSTKRKGAQRIDPPRTVEDPEAGIDIISREELEKLIGVALIPRS